MERTVAMQARRRTFRYGAVLVLTLADAVFTLAAPDGRGRRAAELVAAGACLLIAVATPGGPGARRRVVGIALATLVAAAGVAAWPT